jgi:ribosomal protein S18
MRGLKSKKPRRQTQKVKNKNQFRRKVLSLSQILSRLRQQRNQKVEQHKRQKPIKPIIPPKTLVIILKEKPEKQVYNRRIIDYKHSGLLQRYIGLGGKILPRRQTRLTAKQQRYVAKTIKTARVMGLLPFVSKERSFFK